MLHEIRVGLNGSWKWAERVQLNPPADLQRRLANFVLDME